VFRIIATLQTLAALPLSPLLVWQAVQVRRNAPRLEEPPGPREGGSSPVGSRQGGPRQGNPSQGGPRQGGPQTGEPWQEKAGRWSANPFTPSLRMLIVGDSSAAGVGASHQSEALSGSLMKALDGCTITRWRLVAGCGWTIGDIVADLQATPAEPFDVAVVSVGVNHVTRWHSATRWERALEQLVTTLKARFRVDHIVFSCVPPMGTFPALPHPLRFFLGQRAGLLDRRLRHFSDQRPDCHYLPFHPQLRVEHMAVDGFHPGPLIYQRWADDLATVIGRLMGKGPTLH